MHSSRSPVKIDRPEHEILFCVARRELNDEQQAQLRSLMCQGIDLNYLCSSAAKHGLLPLLHKHLWLKGESVANAQNVLHLLAKQLKLYRLLKDNDVAVALFKGPVLAQMAYGEVSLRQAGDIDVLIARAHFDRARRLLESLGYQMTPPLTQAQLASHLNSHCEIQFMRDDWFTVVDLHWALAPKSFVFNVETDDVLNRLQQVTITGSEIKTFGIEDSVLYQSMHGAKHLWRRLEWISSLGELIRSAESLDWRTLVERAAAAHATRMLALGLRLAETVSEVKIPAHVLASIDLDQSMKKMAGNILAHLFMISGPANSTETNLYNLKIMDRKRDALVSALRAIFVPTLTDWQALTLPASLHSLYYPYRPLRLSKVYTGSLWRKFSQRNAHTQPECVYRSRS